ncbi:MAG: 30S ribosomal protein S20 [Candidatus Portnoybacteria bacterium]|nr:30S ribosomal protein S20 [Candidatus Portnoybacteria bacterium]
MPIMRSAKKELRKNKRRRVRNLRRFDELKDKIKKVEVLAKEGKIDEAQKSLSEAYKAIDKSAKNGLIKKNNASRKKARLARLVKKAKESK